VTVSRPGGLRAGTEIRLGGRAHVVVKVTGTTVRLEDAAGEASEVPLAAVLADRSLELVAAGRNVALATVQRLRLGYERRGLRVLIDGRAVRVASATGRADPRVAPRLGRLPGVAPRWLRQPRLGTHSQGFGACEEDGGRAGVLSPVSPGLGH